MIVVVVKLEYLFFTMISSLVAGVYEIPKSWYQYNFQKKRQLTYIFRDRCGSDIYFIMHMFLFYFRHLFHYAYVSILFQIFISLCICFHFISDIYFIMHMFPFYFRHLFHYAYVSILFQIFISLCICFHFISDIYFIMHMFPFYFRHLFHYA